MTNSIDIYCERLGPGLWAEPVNAVTNAAFLVAALMAYLLARREDALDWRSGLLIALIAAMGIGSTLFHTFAQLWAMIADVLPILLYQMVFLYFYTNRIIGLKHRWCAALLVVFFLSLQGAMALPREWLNGTLEYAPALLFVFGLGLWHWRHAARERYALLGAALVFVASMSFRSIDMAVCETVPLGTHFLWHILNACVLYLTARGFVVNYAPKKRIV